LYELQVSDGVSVGTISSFVYVADLLSEVRDNCGLTELEYHEFLRLGSFERPGSRSIVYWKDEEA